MRADQIVNQQEAQQHLAADGKAAPDGTTAVPVGPGNTISQIMHDHKLDWNNPQDRAQFLKDNPQFTDQLPPMSGQRSADLIFPGESVYVRDPSATTGDANGDGKPDAGTPQATDQAATDYRSALEAQKNAGGAQSTAQYLSEKVGNAQTALQEAAQAEIAAGGSADAIIERNGGINADSKIVIAVRRAATDQAAAELSEAKKTGSGVEQAQAKLDDAVKKEIEASATLFAPEGNGSREDRGKGAVAAGESIKTRLQEAGLNEEANRVTGIAEQVQTHINNEV